MKREDLILKLKRLESDGAKIDDHSGMIFENQKWLLKVMLERLADGHGHQFYDEETDFASAWNNLCDELAEVLKENKP